MIEEFDAYTLTAFQQGILFSLSGFASMMYHYADRYVHTKQRLLTSWQAIWDVIQVYMGMLLGSTIWANISETSNSEIVMAGIILGLAAFGRGISELGVKK